MAQKIIAEKRATTWFVEPLDGATNEALVEQLAPVCGCTMDKVHRGILDAQGNPHDMIEVDYRVVDILKRNRQKFNLKFRIWLRHEGEPHPHEWRLNEVKNIHRTKAGRELTRQLARRRGVHIS